MGVNLSLSETGNALQPNGTEWFVVWFIVIIRHHFSLIYYMVVPVLHTKTAFEKAGGFRISFVHCKDSPMFTSVMYFNCKFK